jgi:predicted nucleic acid-binding protein
MLSMKTSTGQMPIHSPVLICTFDVTVWLRLRANYWLSVKIVSVDQELSELAGELKAVKKMSLADGFAAALAKREKAEIYTGDSEFKTVEREIKVVWL